MTAGAFARQDRQRAPSFAAQAWTDLTTAHRALASERLAGHLDQALRSPASTAQAQGFVLHPDSEPADRGH